MAAPPTRNGSTSPGGGVTGAVLEVYGFDCPIPPAVWRTFTSAGEAVDLLLEVAELASPPVLAQTLLKRLRSLGRMPDVMTVSSFIALSVTGDELAIVLALTSWHRMVERSRALSAAAITAELRDAEAGRPLTPREGWTVQDLGRTRWLVVQFARIVATQSRRNVGRQIATLLERAEPLGSLEKIPPIHTVGVNRPVSPAVLTSRKTVKADAAERLFEVDARDVTWAVVDSGIDDDNRAFRVDPAKAGESRVVATYDIPRAVRTMRDEDPTAFVGLVDDVSWQRFASLADSRNGAADVPIDPVVRHHGTHVAGILAGNEGEGEIDGRAALRGVCPTLRLVDLRVFDRDGRCDELSVIVALRFIRWINDNLLLGKRQIDGVNLTMSTVYEVDAQACGWTPICQEAERVIDIGVVVVAAAGNQAYDADAPSGSLGTGFRYLSITDPGNAEAVITVGATDKRAPHRYGPIAGSGRGPTADGRHKPDLLAPGNRICGPTYQDEPQEMTGTSQAAPHVSAIAAMLLARFPELRGQPHRVKAILRESATDLGRLPDFQGAGLVDALRALQRP